MQRKITGGRISGSATFWLLVVFLVLVFFTGGSSRADSQSLALLRPLSVLICGIAIWKMRRQNAAVSMGFCWFWASALLVVVAQLSPWPAAILPVRGDPTIFETINAISGSDRSWRPISIAPHLTLNALFSLASPLAVFLLGLQLVKSEREKLLVVMLLLGLSSALLGILQVAGDPYGIFYTYRITNNGLPVGLLANRNHQAVFLASLFPILAVFAIDNNATFLPKAAKASLGLIIGVTFIPLILVTGSRAGLAAAAIGIATALWIYARYNEQPKKAVPSRSKVTIIYASALSAALLMVVTTIVMSRAEGLNRILEGENTSDIRFQLWKPVISAAHNMAPFGSGTGSFVPVFQIFEPTNLLTHYLINQAHNDWLDLYLTLGLFGLIVAALFGTVVIRNFLQNVNGARLAGRSVLLSWLAIFILALFGLASFFDYPLRTPMLSCYVAVAMVWLTKPECAAPKKAGAI